MSKKIIFSGGGTGGHIFPAINLMKHFFDKSYQVLLVTDARGNTFLKNRAQFRSRIIRTDTPSNKNFLRVNTPLPSQKEWFYTYKNHAKESKFNEVSMSNRLEGSKELQHPSIRF